MSFYSQKTEKWLFTCLAALVFIYVAIRSVTVPLANDEAATFFNFVHTANFLPFVNDYWTANNHYLNSALTWVSYEVFGLHEWALRLPNLLSLLLYLYFLFQLGKRLTSTWLKWLFWLPLLFSHYLMEFYGYSRGYGLSITFLLGSIHFLLLSQEVQTARYKNLLLSLLMISLGVFSNLNLLVSYLIWVALAQLPQLKNPNRKKWLFFNALAIIPLSTAIKIAFILMSKKELYIGQNSLLKTIHTLNVRFADVFSDYGLYMLVAFLSLLLVAACYLAVRSLKSKFSLNGEIIFLTFFWLNLLAAVLMNRLLEVLFPLERTAMHWMPLMVGFVAFTLDGLEGKLKTAMATAGTLILVVPIVQSIGMVNLHVSSDPYWALEQVPPEFYLTVKNQQAEDDFPPSVSSSTSLNTYTWAFNNLKYQGGMGSCIDFYYKEPQYVADYLILNQKEFTSFTRLYDTLLYDPHSDMTLLERRVKLKKVLVGSNTTDTPGEVNDQWKLLGEWGSIDSLANKAVRLDYTLQLQSPLYTLPSLVTLEMRDSAQSIVYYNQFSLDLLKEDFRTDQSIKSSLILDSVPPSTSSIRTFLWNIDSGLFSLGSSKVELYMLKEVSP